VVVNDLDIENIAIHKTKARTPLTIDTYAPLPVSVAVQRLQAIGWRKPQFVNRSCVLKLIQTQDCAAQDVGRQSPGFSRAKQALGFFIGKTANHASNYKQIVYKRIGQGAYT
jgi:hypothetical protein